eukprot:CAMPEP_0198583460 /NCGR_PEP_ID=MMETSP1462-20131121/126768_1 /TAXON_ID=1333877 /ORGANISM="Brandtodinium nutriculum, Strain RCC3387" /LENGTH=62 /DNA_ID=CAMNT_0044314873 /DNA_START=40 /DNA_END=225 /DNA_ORIENTATION=-
MASDDGEVDPEGDDGDELQERIVALLDQPFEKALEACGPLRAYIEQNEDPAALAEEFRSHWR